MAISPDLEPDHEAMHRHVQSLFGGASAWALGGLVELAWTDASPPHALSHAALFPLTELQALVEKAAALNRRPCSNVYIGAALRRPDVTGGKRCSDADFHAALFAWADIDTDVVEAALARCANAGVPPTLTVITGTIPHKRAQLWWRLDSASVDPAAHRSLCATIGKALGGDPTVANPGRVMRLGGSIAWPVKPGRVPERTGLHFSPSGPSEGHRPATLLERLGGPDLLVLRPAAATAAQIAPPPELLRPEPSLRPHDGLAIGSLSVESTLAAIRSGHRWHEHTLRLVGHWIARGLSDIEILAMAGEITLPGWTVEETRRDLDRMIEGARRKWGLPNPMHALDPAQELSPIEDDIENGENATMIPRRQWVVQGVASRGNVTVLVAPSSAGKSTLSISLAIAVVTGRDDITGLHIAQPTAAWIWNNEDDKPELRRRQNAVMIQANVLPQDLGGRFAMNSGVDRPLVVARLGQNGKVERLPDVDALTRRIKDKGYGLVIVDPLIETHDVDENNNAQMKAVAAIWRDVARKANCAVVLVHHTSKPPPANADAFVGSQFAARGASSLNGVVRFMLTLFAMSERDAERLGVDPKERHLWVRLDGAKANLALIGGEARWFKKVSVTIANGEEVGVLVPADPAFANGAESRRERVRSVVLREVADAWAAWERDGSRLPLSNEPRAPRERRIKDLIPPLAGCSPNAAAAEADRLIASGEIVPAEFTHNKATRRGLRPAPARKERRDESHLEHD
jgi:hypothetical protein